LKELLLDHSSSNAPLFMGILMSSRRLPTLFYTNIWRRYWGYGQ